MSDRRPIVVALAIWLGLFMAVLMPLHAYSHGAVTLRLPCGGHHQRPGGNQRRGPGAGLRRRPPRPTLCGPQRHRFVRESAMETARFRDIAWNGVWKQNTGLVQILGLCPILAISTNLVNAVSLGLATVLVMGLVNLVIAVLRNLIPYEIRIPVFILIIAAIVTAVDLAFNAWLHGLYLVLGIFIPLIVTNCIVLARVEAFAAKNGALESTLDGFAMGIGLTLVLAVLGGLRELVGSGTLLAGIDLVIPGARPLIVLGQDYPGFLIGVLPPGAFFALGCLIAGRKWLDTRAAARARRPLEALAEPAA